MAAINIDDALYTIDNSKQTFRPDTNNLNAEHVFLYIELHLVLFYKHCVLENLWNRK